MAFVSKPPRFPFWAIDCSIVVAMVFGAGFWSASSTGEVTQPGGGPTPTLSLRSRSRLSQNDDAGYLPASLRCLDGFRQQRLGTGNPTAAGDRGMTKPHAERGDHDQYGHEKRSGHKYPIIVREAGGRTWKDERRRTTDDGAVWARQAGGSLHSRPQGSG